VSDLIYNPPGVYVNEDSLSVPNIGAVVALPASRLAIVGPAFGYQTATEAIALTGTDAVTLQNLGIDATSITVTSLSGTSYVASGVDEEDTPFTNWIATQTPTEGGSEATTTIERASSSVIVSGETVYVSYRYTDSSYYLPFLSSDYDEIQSRFGSAFNVSTGAISSPLTLAAKIAMEQGLREVVLVPTAGTGVTSVSRTNLSDAYEHLEARSDIGVVVPMPVGIEGTDLVEGETVNIGDDLASHVTNASADGNYRIGVLGLAKGADRSHDVLAGDIASSRVILAFPNALTYYNGYLNTTIDLDGFYLAVAMGAMIASRNPQEPLTRKSIRSFTAIPSRILSTMTPTFKNNLSENGVAVAEQTYDSRIVVRHGVATDTTSVFTREVSITRAKDTMIRLINRSIENSGLIGSATSAETPLRVRSLVEGVLEQATSTDMIVDYSNLSVRTSPSDNTAIQVKFAYRPAYPLNFVNVSFSINTLTGNTAEV